jgi:hypothetical protein
MPLVPASRMRSDAALTGAHLRVPEGWVVDSNSGRLKRAGQLSEVMLHYL